MFSLNKSCFVLSPLSFSNQRGNRPSASSSTSGKSNQRGIVLGVGVASCGLLCAALYWFLDILGAF